jgi:STE24 endopeptidase
VSRADLLRLLFPPALRLPAVPAFIAAWAAAMLNMPGWPMYAWAVWWAAAALAFARRTGPLSNAPTRPLPEHDETARRLTLLFAAAGGTLPVFIAAPDPPHANAAVIGWSGGRRIVLTEELLKISAPAQVAAVVAHELGHVRRRHHGRWLLAQGAAGLGFALLWTGVGGGVWAALPAAYLWAWALRPAAAALRRRWEFEADAFAAALGFGPALAEALTLLSPPTAPPTAMSMSIFHPMATARIARLNK